MDGSAVGGLVAVVGGCVGCGGWVGWWWVVFFVFVFIYLFLFFIIKTDNGFFLGCDFLM